MDEDEEMTAAELDEHLEERVVKIGPLRYPVRQVDCLWGDVDTTEKLAGKIRFASCDIAVLSGLDPQTERLVLVHEAVHGMLDHMGYHDTPERLVDALSFGIVGLVDDNRWLFEKV